MSSGTLLARRSLPNSLISWSLGPFCFLDNLVNITVNDAAIPMNRNKVSTPMQIIQKLVDSRSSSATSKRQTDRGTRYTKSPLPQISHLTHAESIPELSLSRNGRLPCCQPACWCSTCPRGPCYRSRCGIRPVQTIKHANIHTK